MVPVTNQNNALNDKQIRRERRRQRREKETLAATNIIMDITANGFRDMIPSYVDPALPSADNGSNSFSQFGDVENSLLFDINRANACNNFTEDSIMSCGMMIQQLPSNENISTIKTTNDSHFDIDFTITRDDKASNKRLVKNESPCSLKNSHTIPSLNNDRKRQLSFNGNVSPPVKVCLTTNDEASKNDCIQSNRNASYKRSTTTSTSGSQIQSDLIPGNKSKDLPEKRQLKTNRKRNSTPVNASTANCDKTDHTADEKRKKIIPSTPSLTSNSRHMGNKSSTKTLPKSLTKSAIPTNIANSALEEFITGKPIEPVIPASNFKPTSTSRKKIPQIIHFARQGKCKILERYLAEHPNKDVNATDDSKRTALHYAAMLRNEKMVMMLLKQQKIDINLRDKYRKTPLRYAVESTSLDCVERLVENGANPTHVANDGLTPFEYALHYHGDKAFYVISYLFQKYGTDKTRLSCLHRLALDYHELPASQIAEELILLGADVNAVDGDGKTPLMYAVERKNDALIRVLVEQRSNLFHEDDNAKQIFYYAAAAGMKYAAMFQKELLKHLYKQ